MKSRDWRPEPVRRAWRVVGSKTGLLSDVTYRAGPRGGTPVLTASADRVSLERLLFESVDGDPPMGLGGKGVTLSETATSLFGEFLERYCIFRPLGDRFERVTDTYEGLRERGKAVVSPEYLATADPDVIAESGFEPFDARTTIDWVSGRTLDAGDVLYPAELVSLWPQIDPYRPLGQRSFTVSSNGCACGSSLSGAVLRALYEQIERDALMRTWYTQSPPPRLDLDGRDRIQTVLRRVESPDVTVHLVSLDGVDGVHTVGAIAVRDADIAPKFAIGGSASMDFETAACDAIHEVTQGLRRMKEMVVTGELADDVDLERADNLEDCPQFYARPEQFHHVSFLTRGERSEIPPSPELSTQREELRTLLELLDDEGTTPLLFDITAPTVREMGMCVVRARVPELLDLTVPELVPVEHPRLADDIETRKGHPVP